MEWWFYACRKDGQLWLTYASMARKWIVYLVESCSLESGMMFWSEKYRRKARMVWGIEYWNGKREGDED